MLNIKNFFDKLFYEGSQGENFYNITNFNEWSKENSNLALALEHPIFTPGALFVSKTFSLAKFKVVNTSTGKIVKNHWLLKVLNRPNFYSTRQDLLLSTMFYKIANGVGVIWLRRGVGLTEPDSIYSLNYELIKFPEEFKTEKIFSSDADDIEKLEIIYDESGENRKIKIKDLIFIYDLPVGVVDNKNMFKPKSLIDGLRQTLYNTKDSLIAKNIILKTNGKEMLTLNSSSKFPLTPDDKDAAERLINGKYGLSFSRRRGLVTSAEMTHKSLHIALRDLGLDESVKVDGNIIYTALRIPKDILSLEAKKTTYNNFKESMVSYIQNEIQASIDDFASSISSALLPDDLELIGTFDHLPIMQYINKEKYDGIAAIGGALDSLIKAGIPEREALKMCNLDENIILERNVESTNQQQQQQTSNEGGKK